MRYSNIICIVLLFLIAPTIAMAKPYAVVENQSHITFTGTHAGKEFSGVFNKWDADINYSSEDLSQTEATLTFDLSDAKTGNTLYDGTLPSADWFDVKSHPNAQFKLLSIKTLEDHYKAHGELMIKGITKPIDFNFTLVEDSSSITLKTSFIINRLDYNIGLNSDPNFEWVGSDIIINITLVAHPI